MPPAVIFKLHKNGEALHARSLASFGETSDEQQDGITRELGRFALTFQTFRSHESTDTLPAVAVERTDMELHEIENINERSRMPWPGLGWLAEFRQLSPEH